MTERRRPSTADAVPVERRHRGHPAGHATCSPSTSRWPCIVDLVTPEATSAEILEAEGLPDDAWWEDGPDDVRRRRPRDGRHDGPFRLADRASGLLAFSTARH